MEQVEKSSLVKSSTLRDENGRDKAVIGQAIGSKFVVFVIVGPGAMSSLASGPRMPDLVKQSDTYDITTNQSTAMIRSLRSQLAVTLPIPLEPRIAMGTSQPPSPQAQQKHACSICARRKVKCDRTVPCSNCVKANAPCTYDAPAVPRPRKRAADEDLLARLTRYEHLMRKHNVDFTAYTQTWVPSEFEPATKQSRSDSLVPILPEPITLPSEPPNLPASTTSPLGGGTILSCIWSNLPSELKFPPMQTFYHEDKNFTGAELSLHQLVYGAQSELKDLHPQPKHIYQLWQIFVERVNPLLKFVHVPSLQQRLLDASWNPETATKPLTAIMFSVYTLAMATVSVDECAVAFGDSKDILLTRFRKASFQALIEADYLTTRDFEVLQALVLFLFVEPDSDLTSSLTGSAIRIGQKMGLHLEKADTKISVLEKELRVRLWWHLNGLDSRVRSHTTQGMRKPPTETEFGDVRLPLNVNDTDLHPDMVGLPREHIGPTEMLAVLMKFEIYNWYRTSSIADRLFSAIQHRPSNSLSAKLADEAVQELEAIYQEKFLRHLDLSVPLHRLANAMAKLSIARMRYKIYHPRGKTTTDEDEVQGMQRESDIVFSASVTWLDMVEVAMKSGFSPQIITHFTTMATVDAYIYIISELRRRASGHEVALAWNLVESLYARHPQLIEDNNNKFLTAFGELTLEAWEARRNVLMRSAAAQPSDLTPQFIQSLWRKRQGGNNNAVQEQTMTDENSLESLEFSVGLPLDWDYWNDFLRL
ncbi:putative transcriptional regulatory protein C139.03-like protein 8 [Paramyrothecium foliicola]|nr:putative transcriptional regulatory protein C139.03-like protein 8 [Paramyrothecium foliicola]